MDIGMYIIPSHAVPPVHETRILAPWELTHELITGLSERGHTITLFAASSSVTPAHLCDFGIQPTTFSSDHMSPKDYEQHKIEDAKKLFFSMIDYATKNNMKFIHIMHDELIMVPLLEHAPSSIHFVTTLHNPLVGDRKIAVERIGRLPNCSFVSISNSQRDDIEAPFIATVYNGIDLNRFPFSDSSGDHYVIAGRIVPEKGQSDAICASRDLGKKLRVVGEVRNTTPEHVEYWEKRIKPYIDDIHVAYQSVITRQKMSEEFKNAKALLFPIHWEEPFGLVMIESMASGTPVIAYARGSVPEILRDGVTGFMVNESDEHMNGDFIVKKTGIEGIKEAIDCMEAMTPAEYLEMRNNCRHHVEKNFSLSQMITGYEAVYKQILDI